MQHAACWVPVPQACMRRASASVHRYTGLLSLGKHAPGPLHAANLYTPQSPGSAGKTLAWGMAQPWAMALLLPSLPGLSLAVALSAGVMVHCRNTGCAGFV